MSEGHAGIIRTLEEAYTTRLRAMYGEHDINPLVSSVVACHALIIQYVSAYTIR